MTRILNMTEFRWLTRLVAPGLVAIAGIALVVGATPARAQEVREAVLRITVSDPTGALADAFEAVEG